MSGEEGGASDQEDSAECDGSSPPSFTPLYNEGETTHAKTAFIRIVSEPPECSSNRTCCFVMKLILILITVLDISLASDRLDFVKQLPFAI